MIKYLKVLCMHKFFVMQACCKLGLVWLGIIHDMSKFSLVELIGYIKKFKSVTSFSRDKSGYYDPLDDINFAYAWVHHVHNNKHHWQYWVVIRDDIEGKEAFKILDMPKQYILEMLCDWWGASKAYKGKGMLYFWENNRDKLKLSENTVNYIEDNIGIVEHILNGGK